MPRLNAKEWEKARAEYEARGISLSEIARRFGVSLGAVSQRAKKEGWIQGKTKGLIDRKVNAIKALAEIGVETKGLPYSFRHTIETVVAERLQADGLLGEFDCALAAKGMELLDKAATPADFELIARGRKHFAPQAPKAETTVNVSQQQMIKADNPRDVLAEITRQAAEYPDEIPKP